MKVGYSVSYVGPVDITSTKELVRASCHAARAGGVCPLPTSVGRGQIATCKSRREILSGPGAHPWLATRTPSIASRWCTLLCARCRETCTPGARTRGDPQSVNARPAARIKVCVQETACGRKCPHDPTWYKPGAAERQRYHRGGTAATKVRNHRVWDGRLRRRNAGSHGMSE